MAQREVKQFIELLQCLNYSRPIASDSFQTPNFELVADVLCYLVQRVDPTIPIHYSIGSEDDRVQFLNGITAELAKRLNLTLNTRKLYAADGYAVQELLKLAEFIQRALALAEETFISDRVPLHPTPPVEQARTLAKEIAEIGAKVQGLLKHEKEDSAERRKATIQFLNSAIGMDDSGDEQKLIEESIKQIVEETKIAADRLDKKCKMLISREKGMEEKIRKRGIDLERFSKRLECLTLQKVRPSFMDEYEQLEKELEVEYERYVVRLRNVDYLEAELRSRMVSARKKSDEIERSVKRMQKKFREEELRVLEGSDGSDNDKARPEQSSNSRNKENSRPKDNTADRPNKSAYNKSRGPPREDDTVMNISVQELSMIEVSSATSTTPRDHASVCRSEGSPSYPSGHSYEDTSTGSDMTGSISFNSDDDF
ncbi:hypothetical protein HJC23_009386 [Cyclotella cryptica]|uniref:Clusterin-associated protein 1 n=1 Tax=Cyclotella cryptica TaxID=29204 RepID=A0ABD3PXD1_9STRA